MKKAKLIALMLVITMIVVSCKKETGPTGPTGPQGPAGSAGTANVIYSPWTGFDVANWSAPVNEFGKVMRIYSAAAPGVTQTIIDNGAVLVYFKTNGTQDPSLLPIVQYNIMEAVDQYVGSRLVVGTIEITFYNIGNNVDPDIFTGDSTQNAYRYVIIPGGVAGGKNMETNDGKTSADFMHMSYKEVCQNFNIPE